MPTSPESKKPSRVRQWAARGLLLVASASSLATSMASSPGIEATFTGTPFTVRTDAPKVTRHLRVRVSADKSSSQSVDLHLQGRLTAHWRPDVATEERKPYIRARFADFSTEPGPTGGFGGTENTSQVDVAMGSSYGGCNLKQAACEWLVPLEIELEPKGTPGAADVQWQVTAQVNVVGDEDPAGFAVRISED